MNKGKVCSFTRTRMLMKNINKKGKLYEDSTGAAKLKEDDLAEAARLKEQNDRTEMLAEGVDK